MDIEQKQAEIIDQLVRRASTCNGESLVPIIVDATSHPSLFAFSEILALPNVSQVLNPLLLNLIIVDDLGFLLLALRIFLCFVCLFRFGASGGPLKAH